MSEPTAPPRWQQFLAVARQAAGQHTPLESSGRLIRLAGLVLEAQGVKVPVGSQCVIDMPHDPDTAVLAEVVGFSGERAFLMPAGEVQGLSSGARVRPLPPYRPQPRLGQPLKPLAPNDRGVLRLPLGRGLLGRVVDAHGHPLDHRGPLQDIEVEPMERTPINSMDRAPVRQPLDTGVRAINALLTVGRGQRLGLFAGSGVGKSVLLGMMARFTQADVIVVGLIGERGREVKEFIEDILGEDGLRRSVVVAAPADSPPLVRMQGANYATAIAERFRDDGLDVLLLMDSLSRYAMAQREIALAIGEPPATKGYPPSCFAKLPQLVERSGNGPEGKGSITAFYTVLSEGDDQQDPIADAARAILDGHIVLSRAMAESGIYPAIDIEASASRVMHNVVTPQHQEHARRYRQLYSRYQKSRDLIQLGAYVAGSDPETDQAIALFPGMQRFLMQDMREQAAFAASVTQLAQALGLPGPDNPTARPATGARGATGRPA
ncbi:flagellar protein export ATPase FliI [Aquabacterium sp. A08]|uniref:flagellar protein export ATPase FliI n=1 Tax=Aquabacterium sp. A08 TaxID=2718532 RepID=UPI00141E1122|nr:flagellar protein export ATPase FliI [Aquabacterium sp. A08]NIC41930.1 flagellar protein export ATPase FliI [Aquabacterium sp. A08]NIC41973.1 flagellar protein export ATPase FliI [Aquabacterium sp. A08]